MLLKTTINWCNAHKSTWNYMSGRRDCDRQWYLGTHYLTLPESCDIRIVTVTIDSEDSPKIDMEEPNWPHKQLEG